MVQGLDRLDETDKQAAKELMARCQAHDGYSPCVQLDHSLNFRKDMESWFRVSEGQDWLGLASIFAPMAHEGEISLCVAPGRRRQGIAEALIAAARASLDKAGVARCLLVCDQRSEPGRAFAAKEGARLDREEHAMRLAHRTPPRIPAQLIIKKGDIPDIPAMAAVIAAAFGDDLLVSEAFTRSSFASGIRTAYLGYSRETLAERRKLVATCFVSDEDGALSINTLSVDPTEQGKGYGMEFLCGVIARLDAGRELTLEVDSTNDRALRLYRRAGFEDESVVDYYLVE